MITRVIDSGLVSAYCVMTAVWCFALWKIVVWLNSSPV